MDALIQYIMDYIRSHPDEYREWLKAKGQDVVPTTAWSRRHSNGVRNGRTSLGKPRIPRSGIFCGRSSRRLIGNER